MTRIIASHLVPVPQVTPLDNHEISISSHTNFWRLSQHHLPLALLSIVKGSSACSHAPVGVEALCVLAAAADSNHATRVRIGIAYIVDVEVLGEGCKGGSEKRVWCQEEKGWRK